MLIELLALDRSAIDNDIVDENGKVVFGVAELAIGMQSSQRLRQQQLFLFTEVHVFY